MISHSMKNVSEKKKAVGIYGEAMKKSRGVYKGAASATSVLRKQRRAAIAKVRAGS
jgi:hypothetical protein